MIIDESEIAFNELLMNESLIPNWFKSGIEDALQGKPFFDSKKLTELGSFELLKYLNNPEILNEIGFNLSETDIKTLKKTGWLSEVLISTTLRTNYGWGIPSEDSTNSIVDFLESNNIPGLLEIGAGSGLWSGIISAKTNKDIIACELNLRNDTPKPKYYPVFNLPGEDLLEKHKDYATLFVWTDTNTVGLDIAKKINTEQHLILVGPISVTANKKFYQYLDENFDIQKTFNTHSFSGESNNGYFLKKTSSPKIINNNFFANSYDEGNPKIKLKSLK